jgi:uncharacterized linocin/CFP29 family protein
MNHLLRSHAPISDRGWELIGEEAKERLTPGMASRRLVDFSGPHGWELASVPIGRVEPADVSLPGVTAVRRRVQPLIEFKVPFTVSRAELLDGDRGAGDVDFSDLDRAARQFIEAENAAVFHGSAAAGIDGIVPPCPHDEIELPAEAGGYPGAVAQAVDLLKRNGIEGDYGLALSREEWTRVVETGELGGYPLFDHLKSILDGPIVWTPGLEGAVVLSLRGGDFVFHCGQDVSVGYTAHDAEQVTLYLEASFTFRNLTPEAAVAISEQKS